MHNEVEIEFVVVSSNGLVLSVLKLLGFPLEIKHGLHGQDEGHKHVQRCQHTEDVPRYLVVILHEITEDIDLLPDIPVELVVLAGGFIFSVLHLYILRFCFKISNYSLK